MLHDAPPFEQECGSAIQFNDSVMLWNHEATGYYDQYESILAQNPFDMTWMFKSGHGQISTSITSENEFKINVKCND